MSAVQVVAAERGADAGPPARVLVIHDHQLLAHGLTLLVRQSSAGRVAVVGWAATHDLDAAVTGLRPNVALVCLGSATADGLAAVRRLKSSWPELLLVVQCSPEDADAGAACLDAGVDGVVCTDAGPSALVAAIVAVTGGMNVTPGWLRSSTVSSSADLRPQLNDEEQELWRLITRGLANDAIAEAMHLSNRTLKRRIGRLICKLTVANRVEAAALGGRLGLLDDLPRSAVDRVEHVINHKASRGGNNQGDSHAVFH